MSLHRWNLAIHCISLTNYDKIYYRNYLKITKWNQDNVKTKLTKNISRWEKIVTHKLLFLAEKNCSLSIQNMSKYLYRYIKNYYFSLERNCSLSKQNMYKYSYRYITNYYFSLGEIAHWAYKPCTGTFIDYITNYCFSRREIAHWKYKYICKYFRKIDYNRKRINAHRFFRKKYNDKKIIYAEKTTKTSEINQKTDKIFP